MHRSSEKFYYPISDLTLRRVSKSLDNLIRPRSRYHFSMYYRNIAFYRRRQITEIHLRDWKDVMRVDMKHLHVSAILAWSVPLKTFLKGRQSRDKLPLRFQFTQTPTSLSFGVFAAAFSSRRQFCDDCSRLRW